MMIQSNNSVDSQAGRVCRATRSTRATGFTLVELLVVIGIIAVLIGMLMPALTRARAQANAVACMSNLKQVGFSLQIYSESWGGVLFPPGMGADKPAWRRWPVVVFKMKYPDTEAGPVELWQPKVMVCPRDVEPAEGHTYIVNDHLTVEKIKYTSRRLGGLSPSDVIVVGEKRATERDYYMNTEKRIDSQGNVTETHNRDFPRVVEPLMHGRSLGSNYLHLDWSVRPKVPKEATLAIDPWTVASENLNPPGPVVP